MPDILVGLDENFRTTRMFAISSSLTRVAIRPGPHSFLNLLYSAPIKLAPLRNLSFFALREANSQIFIRKTR